jgi:hypothetical protein
VVRTPLGSVVEPASLGPSAALPSLHDGNFAQDDSGKLGGHGRAFDNLVDDLLRLFGLLQSR